MPQHNTLSLNLDTTENRRALIRPDGPVCLVIRGSLQPVGNLDRFQPAGFPEIGHVIYEAPRADGQTEKICIVDSPASMANHLEAVCLNNKSGVLHNALNGLPYVRCVTDQKREQPSANDKLDHVVFISLTEGHRLASDYFLDGRVKRQWKTESRERKKNGKEEIIPAHWQGTVFREQLRTEFEIEEIKKDKTYFIPPNTWWSVYRTIFKYDPNSLVHGIFFAKEQIRINRFLSAHLEAFGAARVGRSGVKFDKLGKTTSGQPIFAVDEETAREIRATFILDLSLLRSYGHGENGLNEDEKYLLLEFSLWKIQRLLNQPFKYRTECFLTTKEDGVSISVDARKFITIEIPEINIEDAIRNCNFGDKPVTDIYYPSRELYKAGVDADSEDTSES